MSYANHTEHVHCVRKLQSLRMLRSYETICFRLKLSPARREMLSIMLIFSLALSSCLSRSSTRYLALTYFSGVVHVFNLLAYDLRCLNTQRRKRYSVSNRG